MIRPCPFCRGSGKVSVSRGEVEDSRYGKQKAKYYFGVKCNNCHARGSIVTKVIVLTTEKLEDIVEYQRAYDRAIELWNRWGMEGQTKL